MGENEEFASEDEASNISEILLPPPHQGKFTYAPKPPPEFWLEIEAKHKQEQIAIKERMKKGRIEDKIWEEKEERRERIWDEKRASEFPDPIEPISWWFISSKTKGEIEQQNNEQLDQIDQESKEEEKWYIPRENQITLETDAARASRMAGGNDTTRLSTQHNTIKPGNQGCPTDPPK